MANNKIQIIVEGVDKASGPLGKIGASFGSLGKLATVGVAAGIAGVGALGVGAVKLGSVLVNLGSDAQETGSLIQTSLGDATESYTSRLHEFADVANRSFYELQQGSSTIIAMSKSMGASEQQAADMGVTFAAMASDLGSFFNQSDEQVFLDLQSALAGSTETLQKYGINVKASVLTQMALDQGLIKSAKETIPDLVKAQLIQQAIQEQAADAMGDAARTSDSWANSLRGLKGKITDAATEAGAKLIPALTPILGIIGDLAGKLIPKLTGVFDKIIPFISAFGSGISEAMLALREGDGVIGMVTSFVWEMGSALGWNEEKLVMVRDKIKEVWEKVLILKDKVLEFLSPVTQWIADNVKLKDVLIAFALVLGGVVLSAVVSIVTAMLPIVLTIGAIIGAVVLVRKIWEEDFLGIKTALQTFWDETGQPVFNTLKTWLETNIPVAIEVLKGFWENTLLPAIKTVYQWMNDTLMPFFRDTVVPFLEETIVTAIQTLSDFWTNTLLPAIKGIWEFLTVDMMPVWESLGDLLEVALPLAITALQGVWETLKTKFEEFWNDTLTPIYEFIRDHVIKIFEDWSTGVGGVTGAIETVVGWINTLTEKLSNITLPGWMTPGSPTPWENGLRGVTDAMREVRNESTLLGNDLQFGIHGVGGGGRGNSTSVSNNFNLTVNQPAQTDVVGSFNLMRSLSYG